MVFANLPKIVLISGATVVSWRVNNQEQLFVRWVNYDERKRNSWKESPHLSISFWRWSSSSCYFSLITKLKFRLFEMWHFLIARQNTNHRRNKNTKKRYISKSKWFWPQFVCVCVCAWWCFQNRCLSLRMENEGCYIAHIEMVPCHYFVAFGSFSGHHLYDAISEFKYAHCSSSFFTGPSFRVTTFSFYNIFFYHCFIISNNMSSISSNNSSSRLLFLLEFSLYIHLYSCAHALYNSCCCLVAFFSLNLSLAVFRFVHFHLASSSFSLFIVVVVVVVVWPFWWTTFSTCTVFRE